MCPIRFPSSPPFLSPCHHSHYSLPRHSHVCIRPQPAMIMPSPVAASAFVSLDSFFYLLVPLLPQAWIILLFLYLFLLYFHLLCVSYVSRCVYLICEHLVTCMCVCMHYLFLYLLSCRVLILYVTATLRVVLLIFRFFMRSFPSVFWCCRYYLLGEVHT